MRTNNVSLLVVCCAAGLAGADVGVVSLGTGAPPALVPAGQGVDWPIHYAPLDPRPTFADETRVDIDAATGCFITFSSPMSHRRIGAGWATWSHGYTGDVYYSNGLTSITMELHSPEKIDYFGFYGEPNPFGVFAMTATGSDGSSTAMSTQFPDGSSGATGWGFYTSAPGTGLVSVTVSSDVDFALGEFGMHKVPGPGVLAMLGAAGLMASRRRR
ncbi:MAG: hypothetical protein IT436_18865 [Phycisphaerales bacterium]|nr:hypothetical protein [Phycisphaerales bacterium]